MNLEKKITNFCGRNKDNVSRLTLNNLLDSLLLKSEMAQILFEMIGHFHSQSVGQNGFLVGNV